MEKVFFGQQRTAITSKYQPSPAIWNDCPVDSLLQDPSKGVYLFDNFADLPLPPTLTTQIAFGKYKAFATSGDTIVRVKSINSVAEPGGALSFTHNTDNNSTSLAQYFPSFFLSGDATTSGQLWFEACFAQNSLATNMASTIIGLAETDQFTLATAVPLNASDSPTNGGSFIGFQCKEDGLGVIDTVYSDRATSFTSIATTEGGTLSATYTFIKIGFRYDPRRTTDCVRFFSNNVEASTKMTRTTLTGTTNLKAQPVGPLLASVADSAGTSYAGYLKWWRCAQMFPGESP